MTKNSRNRAMIAGLFCSLLLAACGGSTTEQPAETVAAVEDTVQEAVDLPPEESAVTDPSDTDSAGTLTEAGDAANGFAVGTARDLNGVWQVLNTANYDLEAHHARHAMQLISGPMGPLPDKRVVALGAVGAVPAGESVVAGEGVIPYTDEARAKRDENRANWIDRDPEVKCYLPGVPRATYMSFPFQILQNSDQTLFVYEYANAVRNINLVDPGEAPIDSWMGQSYGQWDGDSFVVEVTAQNGQTWLDRSGNFTSPATVVTERFTKISDDHIRYQATLEDPSIYTEPWTIEMILYRRIGADSTLQEFNCVEFVEELLYGELRKEPVQ